MSLITRQTLTQAQSDRDDVLHRLAVGEDTPRLRNFLATINKKIFHLEKQVAEEESKAKAERDARQAPSQNRDRDHRGDNRRERAPLPEDLDITCCDCTNNFTFSGKDQLFYHQKQYEAPVRCEDCRKARKNQKPAGRDIPCSDCDNTFFFSDAKSRIFEERGWAEPKRCKDCADAHKSLALMRIACSTCSTDFTFSVKAQKDFKAKNWANPKICKECRNKKTMANA